jgi:hypothetical protein
MSKKQSVEASDGAPIFTKKKKKKQNQKLN